LTGVFNNTNINLNTLPCKRTDKVWVSPGTGQGGAATVAGTFTVCAPPVGYVVTDLHEIEFKKLTSTTSNAWNDQNSGVGQVFMPGNTTTSFPKFNTYGGIRILNGTVPGSGKWLIRYRNAPTAGCSPDAPWITEVWTF
jgi:hypothetical protein